MTQKLLLFISLASTWQAGQRVTCRRSPPARWTLTSYGWVRVADWHGIKYNWNSTGLFGPAQEHFSGSPFLLFFSEPTDSVSSLSHWRDLQSGSPAARDHEMQTSPRVEKAQRRWWETSYLCLCVCVCIHTLWGNVTQLSVCTGLCSCRWWRVHSSGAAEGNASPSK